MGLLPDGVLWRKKEAFSDGISSKEKSWYEIIQDDCEKTVSDEAMNQAKTDWTHNTPTTKEAYHFRKIFTEKFGVNRHTILPNYWLPKWNKDGSEINKYTDPSARFLDVYND